MADPFSRADLAAYLRSLVPARPAELQAMEAYAEEHRFPIIGPVSGNICYQIARMIGARRIFELGSGYGYSTAWFAQAVRENGGGEVHHVVWDEDLSNRARGHLERLGLDDLIHYHVSEAVQALREATGPFDLIFNDINKEGYPAAFPVIAEKLRPGGVLIVDNTIWSGRVFDPEDRSASAEAIREFTRQIATDPGWITSIVPVGDGLLVGYKR